MSENTALVRRFGDAWERMKLDEIMDFFIDDAVYTNIPIDPPNRGKTAIRKAIQSYLDMAQAIEFVVHHTAEDAQSGVVMNERTDRFRIGDRWVEARVMGVFEVNSGKITAWRDYFDLAEFQSQLAES